MAQKKNYRAYPKTKTIIINERGKLTEGEKEEIRFLLETGYAFGNARAKKPNKAFVTEFFEKHTETKYAAARAAFEANKGFKSLQILGREHTEIWKEISAEFSKK